MSTNMIDTSEGVPDDRHALRRTQLWRRGLIAGFLAVAAVASVAVLYVRGAPTADAKAVAPPPAQPGRFTGYGFDACTAPSSAAMRAWLASPYRAVGIYFGGVARGCTQANLTPQWVAEQRAAGWRLLPLYVGPQATCTLASKKRQRIDNAHAAEQGRAAADDAVRAARALGLPPDSALIYDMEAYRTDDPACQAGVLDFIGAWTARLHYQGYLSGFYSSVSSGVMHQVAAYRKPGYVRPDYLNFARWDGTATVADATMPAEYWAKRRVKQFRGDHLETWGGVTINIDSSYFDIDLPPAAGFADVDRTGWSDVVALRGTTTLLAYPGNGNAVDPGATRTLSTYFGSMNAVTRIGDLNRDGYPDVVARHKNGVLWWYPGTATGLGIRKQIGTGWNKLREITAVGDLNRDGYPDLVAVQQKNLYLYPGKAGTRLGTRKLIAKGSWNAMSELAGIGDMNRDGNPDLVARHTSTGKLYLYPGRRSGFAPRKLIGPGWGAVRDLAGVGDFDRDGRPDLVAVQKSTGQLLLFRGDGAKLLARLPIATGFGPLHPVS